VAAVVAWYLVGRLGIVDVFYISDPQSVYDYLVENIRNGVIKPHLLSTLSATVIGFLIGSVSGILVGLILALLPHVSDVLDPYISALNSLPRIALAPLMVVFFGITQSAKIALAVSLVFFILLLNARAGVKSVDRDILFLARSSDIGPVQMFWKVLLPTAIPSIFAGLRLGLIYALLGVVSSEMIVAREGLGQLILLYSGTFQMAGVYGILIVLAVLATVFNVMLGWIEKRLLRWQPAEAVR
jgi:NitT/TauT family transport system permease protein